VSCGGGGGGAFVGRGRVVEALKLEVYGVTCEVEGSGDQSGSEGDGVLVLVYAAYQ